MVKAVHIHSMEAQAPRIVEEMRTHQEREVQPSMQSGQAHPTQRNHRATQKHGSYMYPPPYFPHKLSMPRSKYSSGHHHRSASISKHYATEGPARYMVENTSLNSRSRGADFDTINHSRRYATVDTRRPIHCHAESTHGRYHYATEDCYAGRGHLLPPSSLNRGMSPTPALLPPYKSISKKTDSGHSSRDHPLQTIIPNKQGGMSNATGKKADSKSSSLSPSKDQENGKTSSAFMKSPVTLCFERMLGAASYLANNPTPDHVKKQLALKQATPCEESSEGELRKNVMKRKSEDSEDAGRHSIESSHQNPPKRIRGLKPFLISNEEAEKLNELGDDNPFVQLLNDEALYHQVILLMTLEADKEIKIATEHDEPVSPVIGEGFFWRDYPALEKILYDNMESYYKMSVTSRQSRLQQVFNNRMVASIRKMALELGYSFHPDFNDKRLRDRMRCFYKTHLQNAKKRLATMQKHPNSIIHQSQVRVWIGAAKEQLRKFVETADGPTEQTA